MNQETRFHQGEVPYLTFPFFEQLNGIHLAFSTRMGGVSEGYFSSMNLGFGRGDKDENVEENYRRICQAIGCHTEQLVFSDQIHETTVKNVGSEQCQGNCLSVKKLKGIDGLVTNESKVVLTTSYADCVPLFLADENKKVVAASHSGWRGTVGKIGRNTIEQMEQLYGCDREDIKVIIGPSICQQCYEISEDVAEEFMKLCETPSFLREVERNISEPGKEPWESYLRPDGNGKYHLDLWKVNELVLWEAGIKKEHVRVSGVCTCCHCKTLYSHRASNGKRGNLCGFLWMEA